MIKVRRVAVKSRMLRATASLVTPSPENPSVEFRLTLQLLPEKPLVAVHTFLVKLSLRTPRFSY